MYNYDICALLNKPISSNFMVLVNVSVKEMPIILCVKDINAGR